MKIYSKILLITLPLVMLLGIVITSFNYYLARQSVTNLANILLLHHFETVTEIVDQQITTLEQLGLSDSPRTVQNAKIIATVKIKSVDVDNFGYIWVISGEGEVLYHPDDVVEGINITTKPWFQTMQIEQSPQNNLFFEWRNASYIALYSYVPEWDWYLIIALDEQTILGPVAEMSWYVVFIGVLGVTVLAVVLMGFARRLTRPLDGLVAGVERVAQGDLSIRIPVTTSDEIGVLAQAFNGMTIQLGDLLETLEERVHTRTQAIETSAEVSRQITTYLDVDELLQEVVDLLQIKFKLYHAHIYLVDEKGENLLMMRGSGQVGQQLRAKGHHLPIGRGIVGTVASTKQYFLSNNVDNVDNFVRNPLLPQTHSELAVPLRKGDEIMGVLDIQDIQPSRFSLEDVAIIQSIADQTAIAVDNARLLQERQSTIHKLQEVDRAKSQFITMMSHELRTPLNAISGFAELLMLGLSGELPEQAQGDVSLIYANGQHLLALINDILDISQIETGQIQISLEPLAAGELIAEILTETSSLVKDKPVQVISDLPPTTPLIYADRVRLKQILLNLVNNAIKFTAAGHVTIKFRPEENDQNLARFSVIDTGIGISPEKQQEIFDKFQQADMSDAREYGGTGLGLTICRELVSLHHGGMGVYSEEGQGSEFYFTIPLWSQ